MGRKKKRRGRYCWCCNRHRPNERFSGGGWARCLCKECSKLGAEELAFRRSVADIEECLDFDGRILRKRRRGFEAFLNHKCPRVRRFAETIYLDDCAARALYRVGLEAEEAWLHFMTETGLSSFDLHRAAEELDELSEDAHSDVNSEELYYEFGESHYATELRALARLKILRSLSHPPPEPRNSVSMGGLAEDSDELPF